MPMETPSFPMGVYSWSYSQGTFEVHFMRNGEFACLQHPRHTSWSVTSPNSIRIEWADFGSYDMVIDSDASGDVMMRGHYTGHTEHWRKAVFMRSHSEAELAYVREEMAAAFEDGRFGCAHHAPPTPTRA